MVPIRWRCRWRSASTTRKRTRSSSTTTSRGRSNPIELVELGSPPLAAPTSPDSPTSPCHRPVRRPITDTSSCYFPYGSATVWCKVSAVVADSVMVQAITPLAMAPKPRLSILTNSRPVGSLSGIHRQGAGAVSSGSLFGAFSYMWDI